MSSELFVPIKFNTTIQLKPNEIGPNIQDIILAKIKANLENLCSKHGYIKRNSIKIIKRSIGQLVIPHFNGNIIYDLQCVGEICNPAQGSIIKCVVKAKNSLGLLAEGFYDNTPILQIIVPKVSAGMQSEINIDEVIIGETINIEVCGKKFLLYDKYISIIGKAIKDKDENIQNVVDEFSDAEDDKNTEDNDNITIGEIIDSEDEKTSIGSDEEEDDEDVDEEEDAEDDEDISLGGDDDGAPEEIDEPFTDFDD